jgi:hypothetical protein
MLSSEFTFEHHKAWNAAFSQFVRACAYLTFFSSAVPLNPLVLSFLFPSAFAVDFAVPPHPSYPASHCESLHQRT